MILGSLMAAPISNRVGRKITCIVGIGVIFALSYTVFIFPVNIGLLYTSRLMMGVGLGVSQSISTIYIAEVATLHTRASLAVVPAMTGCLGVVSCQVLAKFLQYTDLAAEQSTPPSVFPSSSWSASSQRARSTWCRGAGWRRLTKY